MEFASSLTRPISTEPIKLTSHFGALSIMREIPIQGQILDLHTYRFNKAFPPPLFGATISMDKTYGFQSKCV